MYVNNEGDDMHLRLVKHDEQINTPTHSKPTREVMIAELIERDIEVNFSDTSYIREVLWVGFPGYNDLSIEQIQQEYDELQGD
jgi:hypothetical protein